MQKLEGIATRVAVMTAVSAIAAGACTQRPLVHVDPGTESYVLEEFAQAGAIPVDVLVVVDDSMSMKEEQDNLALQFPALIRALLDPPVALVEVSVRRGEKRSSLTRRCLRAACFDCL